MKMKLKPGFKWHDGDQVPTRPATFVEIMSDPRFALGVRDARAGRGFPTDYDDDTWKGNDQWCYERGRIWAQLVPRRVALTKGGEVTAEAVDWYLKFREDIL